MSEENITETYLCISENKYEIYLFDKDKLKKLFSNEISINCNSLDRVSLGSFLDENIIKIEKLNGKFIKNISIIIENEKIFQTQIGIKKKSYNQNINYKAIKSLLMEAKELFQKSHKDQKIIHMIINNYLIDGRNFDHFEKEILAEELSLIINFTSIPDSLSYHLEKVLEKYQVKINKYLHKKYVMNFFKDETIKFPLMIFRILEGSNLNEVQLVPKVQKNKGFFEKFFQLFS